MDEYPFLYYRDKRTKLKAGDIVTWISGHTVRFSRNGERMLVETVGEGTHSDDAYVVANVQAFLAIVALATGLQPTKLDGSDVEYPDSETTWRLT